MSEWTEHAVTEDHCPNCGSEMCRASSRETKAPPTPGDWLICIDCGALLRWGDAHKLRLATQPELASLDPVAQREIARIQTARRLATEIVRRQNN
jgi:hypothetical protein